MIFIYLLFFAILSFLIKVLGLDFQDFVYISIIYWLIIITWILTDFIRRFKIAVSWFVQQDISRIQGKHSDN